MAPYRTGAKTWQQRVVPSIDGPYTDRCFLQHVRAALCVGMHGLALADAFSRASCCTVVYGGTWRHHAALTAIPNAILPGK